MLPIDEILSRLKSLKTSREDEQWSIGRSGSIRVRSILDKILEYASIFKDAGAAIAGCDPTQNAGLAWSLLQCLITV